MAIAPNKAAVIIIFLSILIIVYIKIVEKKKYLHLTCQASTASKWDSFFKIRDLYESYVDPITLKPSIYKRNISEGTYTKTEKYIFKPNKTVFSTSQKKNLPQTQKTIAVG